MVPSTYLLTSPDMENAVGRTMMFSTLRAGLQKANPRITIPSPREFSMATGFDGLTAIWSAPPPRTGDPPNGSFLITSVRAGVIPEWTTIRPDGTVQSKGWRAIFEKIIRARVVSQARLEYIFNVQLDSDRNHKQRWCPRCLKGGRWARSTGKKGLCDTHAWVEQDQGRLAKIHELLKPKILKETTDAIRSETT